MLHTHVVAARSKWMHKAQQMDVVITEKILEAHPFVVDVVKADTRLE